MIAGVQAFAEDVRARRYPEPEHGYTMAPDERERLQDDCSPTADERVAVHASRVALLDSR